MNKIKLIILREYLTRVKKKSFIIMTVLGPILIAALIIAPTYISKISDKVYNIEVLDESGLFSGRFENSKKYKFKYVNDSLEKLKNQLSENVYAILYIPKTEVAIPNSAIIYSKEKASIALTGYIKSIMEKEVEQQKLGLELIKEIKKVNPNYNNYDSLINNTILSKNLLNIIKTKINLTSIEISDKGEKESYSEVNTAVAFIVGMIIYFFIFMFGSQVMRGVIEEKASRIVEVIVSSVKPFQLMMGKIIGVALVGLTQFLLWIALSATLVVSFQHLAPKVFKDLQDEQVKIEETKRIPSNNGVIAIDETANDTEQISNISKIADAIMSINYVTLILTFLFYFIGGYLLYAAFFAAIGSAVDNETDTQQFILPITIPLILSIILIQLVANEPNGAIALWFSMIPLTSPIIMMVRIPFGVPIWQVSLSMFLLIITFIAAVWFAGKIYRTGILMYGKKINYAELWKWLKYKS